MFYIEFAWFCGYDRAEHKASSMENLPGSYGESARFQWRICLVPIENLPGSYGESAWLLWRICLVPMENLPGSYGEAASQ